MAEEQAKGKEQDASSLIIETLEQVKQRLDTTNELLRELITRMPQEQTTIKAAGHGHTPPNLGEARFLAAGGPAGVGEDEGILLELARPHDLEMPVKRLIALRNDRYAGSHPRYWAVVNFDLHSAEPRLFVFDTISRTVDSYLCAHGIGSEGSSDDGYATTFSNKKGSKASSLGIYRCAETYHSSNNGYSLRLDGLETTNSNARSRLIVMHGADYVSKTFAAKYGRIGRSDGCPALDHQHARTVIDQLELGSFLIHWKTP
jgi:hypothetical protein